MIKIDKVAVLRGRELLEKLKDIPFEDLMVAVALLLEEYKKNNPEQKDMIAPVVGAYRQMTLMELGYE